MTDNNKILVFDDSEDFLKFMDHLETLYKKNMHNEEVENNISSGVGK